MERPFLTQEMKEVINKKREQEYKYYKIGGMIFAVCLILCFILFVLMFVLPNHRGILSIPMVILGFLTLIGGVIFYCHYSYPPDNVRIK